MTSFAPALTYALLQAACMCIAQLLPGFSFALALQVSPSPFAVAAVAQYYRRTRYLDVVWLIGASSWAGIAFGASTPYWPTSGTAAALGMLAVGVSLGTVGFQGWARWVYARELTGLVGYGRSPDGSARTVTVTAGGEFLPVLQEPVEPPVPSTVRMAMVGYGVLLTCVVGTFGVVIPYIALSTSLALVVWAFFVLALYIALAVLGADLMHDVWPGTTSRETLQRTFTYYVYIFEQWRNWTLPGALLVVMVGSVTAVATGTVSGLFLGFPVWSVGCLVFAALWNTLLYRRGRVRQQLPLPLCKNHYSAEDPLWAHFVTVMHIGMAPLLVVDIVLLNVSIFGA